MWSVYLFVTQYLGVVMHGMGVVNATACIMTTPARHGHLTPKCLSLVARTPGWSIESRNSRRAPCPMSSHVFHRHRAGETSMQGPGIAVRFGSRLGSERSGRGPCVLK
eukprot:scaffold102089_cov78-Phaeocystis_antarctica.AAC.2